MGRQRRREEGLRVRVHRPRAEAVAVRRLDDLAEVHDRDPVADVGHGRQVVADEEIAHTEGPLQVLELVDDLRAHRHVERGHRLVQHDEPCIGRQRSGDRDPLPLPAAELVREQRGNVGLQADQGQHLGDALADRGARELRVDLERLGDDVAHAHPRAQRAERILEHHLHRAAVAHQLGACEVRDVAAFERDRAGGGHLLQQNQLRRRGLAAAGFADEAKRLPAMNGEVDAVDGLHPRRPAPEQPLAHGEVLLQPPDLKNG